LQLKVQIEKIIATRIKDTSGGSGKFSASVVDNCFKFATNVVDTSGAPRLANISANFETI
jgi:hypothetical protein